MAGRSDGKARAGAATPRWVKLSVGAASVLLLLFVGLLLAGHNPARHFALTMSTSPAAPGVDAKP